LRAIWRVSEDVLHDNPSAATGFRMARARARSGAALGSPRWAAVDVDVPAAGFFENARRRQFAFRILAAHP
jgi:hypothetical protein